MNGPWRTVQAPRREGPAPGGRGKGRAMLSLLIRALSFAALLLPAACATTDAGRTQPGDIPAPHLLEGTIGLDHVLVWSRDQVSGEDFLRDRLGFRLTEMPGDYGAGIANKLIWLRNLSFIEFLWLADPDLARDEAPEEFAFVSLRNGSNAFGLQVTDVDAAHAALERAALRPLQPSAETYDFDGPDGPLPAEPCRWRFMFLESGSLPGNPFFVDYNLPPDADVPRSDQPNGARRLSSVWILVDDVEAATDAYRRAGFRSRGPEEVPGVGKGVALVAGEGEVLLISPGDDAHRKRLERFGPHVVGISVEVESLAATRQLLQERLGRSLPLITGAHGASVRPPTLDGLGVHVEFHE